jgi:hypothetical protein
MIGLEDSPYTFAYPGYYKILPMIHDWSTDPIRIKDGKKVPEGFTYCSDSNRAWMSINELKMWTATNQNKVSNR